MEMLLLFLSHPTHVIRDVRNECPHLGDGSLSIRKQFSISSMQLWMSLSYIDAVAILNDIESFRGGLDRVSYLLQWSVALAQPPYRPIFGVCK
jgi:hypothetical protein